MDVLCSLLHGRTYTGHVPNSDHSTAESRAPGNWQTERYGRAKGHAEKRAHGQCSSVKLVVCAHSSVHVTDHVQTANCKCPEKGIIEVQRRKVMRVTLKGWGRE